MSVSAATHGACGAGHRTSRIPRERCHFVEKPLRLADAAARCVGVDASELSLDVAIDLLEAFVAELADALGDLA